MGGMACEWCVVVRESAKALPTPAASHGGKRPRAGGLGGRRRLRRVVPLWQRAGGVWLSGRVGRRARDVLFVWREVRVCESQKKKNDEPSLSSLRCRPSFFVTHTHRRWGGGLLPRTKTDTHKGSIAKQRGGGGGARVETGSKHTLEQWGAKDTHSQEKGPLDATHTHTHACHWHQPAQIAATVGTRVGAGFWNKGWGGAFFFVFFSRVCEKTTHTHG